MKHLTLIGAIFCLTIAITDLIVFPLIIEGTNGAWGTYIGLFVAFIFGFIVLLNEYIQQEKREAFEQGQKYYKDTFTNH